MNGKGSFINCSQIKNWGYCVFTCAKELNITVLFSGFSAMLPKLKLLVIENGVIHMTIAACELIPIVSHTEGIRSVYLGRCGRGDYLGELTFHKMLVNVSHYSVLPTSLDYV